MTEIVPPLTLNTRFGRVHWRRLRLGTVLAATWLALVVVGAVFAPLLAPYGPNTQDLGAILQGPSLAHWLGTDSLGRDILSRLMFGAPPTLISVGLAVICFAVIGSVVGLIAGYQSGWTDRITMAIVSIVIAMPGIIVMFVVLSVYRNNTYLAMTVFGILSCPVMALMVRSAVLAIRNELFVDAARVSGLSSAHIIFRHILPRIRTLIVVQGSLFAANAVVLESAVSFLGFGRQAPEPTWGNMVSEAASQISLNPWMLYPTGGAVFLTALALGVIGDELGASLGRSWKGSKLTPARKVPRNAPAPALQTGALLKVRGLEVGYQTDDGLTTIVYDVGLTIERGETLGLVGESGSGKTTVAFGVLGVVGRGVEISKGQVLFNGVDLLQLDDKRLAALRGRHIAYVAQEPMVALDPNLRIGAQLDEVLRRAERDMSRAERRARAIELLTTVEIRDPGSALRRYPSQLSGGMAQRVSIAYALAGRPELLIADEPTTALDVTVQAGILGLLLRLQRETGMSMLVITHDWGVIADVCDRVAVMYRGHVVEDAPVRQIFTDPQHPYTRALLTSNPHGATPGIDLPVITSEFSTEPAKRVTTGGSSR
ncbi:dipeptide/oligopeptide/nickel ABC transporter permease/ATP-binding protein [Rathayibacter soli]|uniref:dipeptide/oligopeptide/nickel ABC transporter permease/ATP-binding protein n=1 Tax=Rathayibacter soli TaxID=3144168 RepID=UPI0027E455E5|nr:dipeptide/oligopeptide/nickel ABC transporter permease/ATP-binding protein [Glaciibacter superstes]